MRLETAINRLTTDLSNVAVELEEVKDKLEDYDDLRAAHAALQAAAAELVKAVAEQSEPFPTGADIPLIRALALTRHVTLQDAVGAVSQLLTESPCVPSAPFSPPAEMPLFQK